MAEKLQKLMNDNPVARWSVLILVALMMFFAYMFVDVMSPLKSLVETSLGWDSGVFGTYAASFSSVIFSPIIGVLVDKKGHGIFWMILGSFLSTDISQWYSLDLAIRSSRRHPELKLDVPSV